MMEQSSCKSETESCRSDDSAFAKTPIRAESAEAGNNTSEEDSSSSGASAHVNYHGDKTYFHVWSDMLTCTEMSMLDQRAAEEEPPYIEGEDQGRDIHRPLSIDTSLPCPLIQFGPIPKKRRAPQAVSAAAATTKPATATELAGDVVEATAAAAAAEAAEAAAPAPSSGHNHSDDCHGEQQHDERCCDFSLVAAKNRARLREQQKLKRREQKKLVRY